MKNTILTMIACALAAPCLVANPVVVQSPDGRVSVSFEVKNEVLLYSVQREQRPVVAPSQVEIFAGAKMSLDGHSVRETDSSWKPVYGQFSTIRDHHRELTLSLTADGMPVKLLCRAFDTGIGFRFVLPRESKGKEITFTTQDKVLEGSSSAVSTGAGQVTPWRTILVGESGGDLMVNTVALNLAAPCQLKDTSWIKPGKGLWDWRVHGYDNGDFDYGIDTRSYLHYIDFCAAQGIEYFTVDDHWFKKAGQGKMEVAPEVDIEKVMRYAREKGVMIMLYYDRKKGDFGDDTLFSHYAGLGAAGMKYGFMGNRAGFTRDAMKAAAENKLLINFHDGPVPMTGVERTLPNLITREYCHGQQDSRSAFTPETFLKMAMVSALSGPLDMSNGNFGIKSINAGEREKGPRKKNSYISTVVSEVARNLVIYTGLVTLPDAPEEYLKKADLFEFLKVMPASWDDTRVLNSKIGEHITVARRSGDVWFVASVTDQTTRTLRVPLDFLDAGKSYRATLYQDAPDSHGVKNPEAYEIKTTTVRHRETRRGHYGEDGRWWRTCHDPETCQIKALS